MANVHIRDVPEVVIWRLKRRAVGNGRSLNAEIVATLEDASERRSLTELLDEIDEFARRHPLPPGAPMPEELIREDRDSR